MPTNKVEPVVSNAAAEGETKPKRVRNARKPSAPKSLNPGEVEPLNAPFSEPATPAKKAPRRRTSTPEPAAPARQETDSGQPLAFSTEDISVRAYFIGEHRQSLGIAGDSEGDWLEAERQLRSEALGIAASLRKK